MQRSNFVLVTQSLKPTRWHCCCRIPRQWHTSSTLRCLGVQKIESVSCTAASWPRCCPPHSHLYVLTAHNVQTPKPLLHAEDRVRVMHPRKLAVLLRDPEAVAEGLIAMRTALPGADVSAIVCSHPELLAPERVQGLEQVRMRRMHSRSWR